MVLSVFYASRIFIDFSRVAIANPNVAVADLSWARDYMTQFAKRTEIRARWIATGVSEAKINLISKKLERWGNMESPWYVCVHGNICSSRLQHTSEQVQPLSTRQNINRNTKLSRGSGYEPYIPLIPSRH